MTQKTRRRRFKRSPSLRVKLLRDLIVAKYKREYLQRVYELEVEPLLDPLEEAIRALEEMDFERDEVYGSVELPAQIINDGPQTLIEKFKAFIARIILMLSTGKKNRKDYSDLP